MKYLYKTYNNIIRIFDEKDKKNMILQIEEVMKKSETTSLCNIFGHKLMLQNKKTMAFQCYVGYILVFSTTIGSLVCAWQKINYYCSRRQVKWISKCSMPLNSYSHYLAFLWITVINKVNIRINNAYVECKYTYESDMTIRLRHMHIFCSNTSIFGEIVCDWYFMHSSLNFYIKNLII